MTDASDDAPGGSPDDDGAGDGDLDEAYLAVADERQPLEALEAVTRTETEIVPGLRHLEVNTRKGLLTLLWHGDPAAERVVLMCGGAHGGVLGPADAVYQTLGGVFADQGIGTIRVGYRQPTNLPLCLHDVMAAADLASRYGADKFVTVGHAWGGAVAIQAGVMLQPHCRGVVTLSTQIAGCEPAASLGDTPLLLLHGERDELLPPETSHIVQGIAGHGEVVVVSGAGHLFAEAVDDVRSWLAQWIPERFEDVPAFD
jgi:fermentation-respiration switch protein FrsA (DUF1100 family)